MASREEIRVDVVSKYDDTGADAAIKDAALIDKLSPTLDINTTKPTTAMGRLKKTATDTFGSISQMAATAGLAAGGAMVAFAAKAVTAFGDAAIAAGRLSDSTGLAVEDASRWTAVADDIGISSEGMSKGFEKLAVSIGKGTPLLAEYGIEVEKTASGQVDMNETMLNAIDAINGIEDPTKKAAAAQAAFGKGWADMAELIAQGSDSLRTSMDQVSDSQIIDADEVEKARKFREAMDNLGDEMEDFKLAAGEGVVPVITVLAQGLTGLSNGLGAVFSGTQELFSGARRFFDSGMDANFEITEAWDKSENAAADFNRELLDGLTSWEQVHEKVLAVTGDLTAANIVANEFAATQKEIGRTDFGHAPAAGIAAIAEKNADERARALALAQARVSANAQGITNVFLPQSSPAVVHDKGEHWIQLNTMRTGP